MFKRENILAASSAVIAIVAVLSFLGAFHAYKYYENSNRVSLSNALEMDDNEIYRIAMENKPYLLRTMYAIPPQGLSAKDKAIYYFQALFDEDIKPVKWKTVPELLQVYTKNEMMRTNEGKRVIESILVFEKVLFLTESVFKERDSNILKNTIWPGYTEGYIQDFGSNPFFLTAIHMNHCYGYLSADYTKHLKEKLENNPVVKTVYEDMTKPDWVSKRGKYLCEQ